MVLYSDGTYLAIFLMTTSKNYTIDKNSPYEKLLGLKNGNKLSRS